MVQRSIYTTILVFWCNNTSRRSVVDGSALPSPRAISRAVHRDSDADTQQFSMMVRDFSAWENFKL